MPAARAHTLHRVIRVVTLVAFAAGVGLLIHRVRRTPEQQELTRYVNVEVPGMRSLEGPIHEQLARLNQAPGPKPEEARSLLVDDVIPRLLSLRKQVAALDFKTYDARQLNAEYLAATDQLLEACRACVRVIDDPSLPEGAGLVMVRERFADVRRAYQTWDGHVRAACVQHRLAPPVALPHP